MINQLAQINFNSIKIPAKNGVININDTNLNIGTIISNLLPYIFTISGILLLIYLLFGGIQLMLSGGDPKAAQSAKSHITNAFIGFVVIFTAFWIVQLFGLVLGLKGINNIFSNPSSLGP